MKQLLLASIDFEYNRSKEPNLNLVCCAINTEEFGTESFWLHKEDNAKLVERIEDLASRGYKFVAYNVIAEARSFLSLGLNPLDYEWYDLYLEYRCLTNHNHNFMYGKQYKDGREVYTSPPKPKYQRTEEDDDEANNAKPDHNLGSALYKLLGVKIDTAFKDASRNLIISDPERFTPSQKEEILRYCESDVEFLIPGFISAVKEYKRLLGKKFNSSELSEEMMWRSEFAARSAIMEQTGYPINVEAVRNFSDRVTTILYDCQADINSQFPDRPPFRYTKKGDIIMSFNTKLVKEEVYKWIKSQGKKIRWMKTNSGDISLKQEAFKKFFNYNHNYPRGNYFAQILRYLNLKKNINGFSPTSKKTIWEYVGSDGRVRPYMGIYGAQSARSQPAATGFIPLKSAWMRCMIEPKKGWVMIGIDYASQEFMLGALEFRDKRMIKAYESGDVYLGFLKDAGVVPVDATKHTHGKKRQEAKPVILGLSYDMTEIGLSNDLTEKWGRPVSESEALVWVKRHHRAYPDFWSGKDKASRDYRILRHLKLADGWYMWGDNQNVRSVGNCKIQGMASCIMRKAVQLAQDKGLIVSYTLHDAVYIMARLEKYEESVIGLAECMDEAVRFFYPEQREVATIRLDAEVWGTELKEDSKVLEYSANGKPLKIPVNISPRYIDERAVEQYEQFKKYLYEENDTDLDLEDF